MLDQMANHATRVNQHIDTFGYETVEMFIDTCLSLESLIDPYLPHIRRTKKSESKADAKKRSDAEGDNAGGRFPAKMYMDRYINPEDILEEEADQKRIKAQEMADQLKFPKERLRDVLHFLIQYAPLEDWQRDVLSIIRDEAYYFAPQGQTKIMNEGWASFWHSTIMTKHGLTDQGLINYADHHSGTMATSPNRLNPYKLGIELLKDIEERWNKGQFGLEYLHCDDPRARRNWDKQLGLGQEKIFEVRAHHNDVTFIDEYLDEDFCHETKMFLYDFDRRSNKYVISNRGFPEIKKRLLDQLTNFGQPRIRVIDGNYKNRGELLFACS
jgi:stage V sporulation protein R